MSLRCTVAIAAALMSCVMLGVEAKGAEMLTLPGREIGVASFRELSETNATTTTAREEETTAEADGETTAAEESTAAAEEEEATAAGTEEGTTSSAEEEERARAVVSGTVGMQVANKVEFCADAEALDAIARVLKKNSGADEASAECEARRLADGALRRLEESVSIVYEIVIMADAADGTFDASSEKVQAVTDAIGGWDASTLQELVQAEFTASSVSQTVTVTEVSEAEVTIEDPTAVTTTPQREGSVDASSRPAAWACSLLAAGMSLFTFRV